MVHIRIMTQEVNAPGLSDEIRCVALCFTELIVKDLQLSQDKYKTNSHTMATARHPPRANHLYCQICQEVFQQPKLLSCFDSFCLPCLERLAEDHGPDTFPCPSCHRIIDIPPEGVQTFMDNRHISEEDLQRERLRSTNLTCPEHPEEMLKLFCREAECDRPICQLCGLTAHPQHRMEILTEVANVNRQRLAQELERLEHCIGNVSTMLHMAQGNLTAAQDKARILRDLVYSQHRIMIARITQLRDKVLEGLADVSRDIESDLNDDMHRSEEAMDFLRGLQRRVMDAINGTINDVEVVAVDKEMRTGRGSAAELDRFSDLRRSETARPGLFSFTGNLKEFLDKNVLLYLGSPVKLMVPNRETSDVIRPFYRCGSDDSVREIHSIFRTDDRNLHVAYGGKLPVFAEEKLVHLDSEGVKLRQHLVTRKISFDKSYRTFTYAPIPADFYHDLQANSNGEFRIKASFFIPGQPTTIQRRLRNAPNARPVDFEINAACRPHGFDANAHGSLFVVINEEEAGEPEPEDFGHRTERVVERRESRKSVVRTVRLYRKNFSDPAAVYRSQLQHFFPTAVSFWKIDNQELILIADLMNDCVHVVRVSRSQFHFKRFLHVSGRGDLVRPTALEVDQEGIIWIGCETGLLLKCQPSTADLLDAEQNNDEAEMF
ncbi:hypothetical protein ACOMHN_041903 [Nucella lapillus]